MANKYAVSTIFKAQDKITAPIRKMESKVHKFTKSLERGFRRANNAITKVIDKMRSGFTRGALVLGGAIAGVGFALKKVADRADDLSKQAKILDLPIEELQKWQFVAEQSGLSSDTFTKAMGMLNFQIGQAKSGTGTLVTLLKKTNPQLLKQLTNTKDTSQAMNLILGAIHKMKDPMMQAALARSAMGRAGLKTIIIAKASTKALAKLREEATKNGLITQKQATAAEAFNDQLNSLMHTFQGVLQEALLPLMPVVKQYLVLIQQWIFAHKKLITSGIKDFIMGVGNAIKFLVKHGKTIAIIVTTVLSVIVVLKTLIAVMTIVNAVMDANPVADIVLGIAALVAGVILAIKHFKQIKAVILALISPFTFIFKVVKYLGKKIFSQKPIDVTTNLRHFHEPSSNTGSHLVSPQTRMVNAITSDTTTTNKSEITIKDDTNKAAVTKGKLGTGVTLQQSGAF